MYPIGTDPLLAASNVKFGFAKQLLSNFAIVSGVNYFYILG